MELGKDLTRLNLKIVGDDIDQREDNWWMIDYIIVGCPKLKSLSLESLRGCDERNSKGESPIMFDLSGGWEHWILKESLEELYKRCKDLKDLKFTKVSFENLTTEDAVKSIFPGCNVEIKNCEFLYIPSGDTSEEESDDSSIVTCYSNQYDSDHGWFDYYSDGRIYRHRDGKYVSFDNGEQDSSSEGSSSYESCDEANDILDNFDGGEIKLMFSEN